MNRELFHLVARENNFIFSSDWPASSASLTMDLHKISTEETETFETMLDAMEPKLLQGYKAFLQQVIIKGISHHNLPLNTLRSCLVNLNKDTIDCIVEKAISYYEIYAPGDIKSFDN